MADTKISALTAVTSPAGTDEFAVNQGGSSKKMTLTQVVTYAESQLVGKQAIWVPATQMTRATTNPPSALTQLETATNKQNYQVLDFDATTQEFAHFQMAMPKKWNEGTVTFKVFWSSTATDTDGVSWKLEAGSYSDNEAIDAAWGTGITIDDACQSAAGEVYVSDESSAITIGGSPTAQDLVFFRLSRDVGDSNDTAAEDARLIGIMLYIVTDDTTDA